MDHKAELPADDGVAGEGDVKHVGPVRRGPGLLVGPHDDVSTVVKETFRLNTGVTPLSGPLS